MSTDPIAVARRHLLGRFILIVCITAVRRLLEPRSVRGGLLALWAAIALRVRFVVIPIARRASGRLLWPLIVKCLTFCARRILALVCLRGARCAGHILIPIAIRISAVVVWRLLKARSGLLMLRAALIPLIGLIIPLARRAPGRLL